MFANNKGMPTKTQGIFKCDGHWLVNCAKITMTKENLECLKLINPLLQVMGVRFLLTPFVSLIF